MRQEIDDPLVSIVMPVKNAGKYLDACLESIIKQSFSKWELLAVNDHSEDDSYDILTTFAQQDDRIQIFNAEGNGIIDALRQAYYCAKGGFVTRMDADDIMSENKLEVFVNLLIKNGKGSVATACVKYFSDETLGAGYKAYESWLNEGMHSENPFAGIYKECVIPSPSWMMYKDDFDRINAFNENVYPEDYDLVFRMFKGGFKIIASSEVLHYWRDYKNRTSRNDDNYKDNRFLDLKCRYFLELHYDKKKEIIIWGAGKKGKTIARYFHEKGIKFRWVCNNPRKIGREILGIVLETDAQSYDRNNNQIIIAVAIPDEQKFIMQTLDFSGFQTLEHSFYFC